MATLQAIAQTAAAAVGATKSAIDIVGSVIEGLDRSCIVEIDNMTADTLELAGHSHESGGWQQGPPQRIAAFDHGLMTSGSTAIAQGAVGTVSYRGRDVDLTVDFGNPFVGDNRIDARVSGARAGEFQTAAAAGGGNTRAHLHCVVMHPFQDNWRFCGRCHGMFFNGGDQNNHRCPGGDFHVAMGFEFLLPHSIPDGPRVQTNWNFCPRCHGMFFNDDDKARHRCPSELGQHDPVGLTFSLPHDLPETRALQRGWRFCAPCHGLFWSGPDAANHRCPAGDLHSHAGLEFSLPHRPA